MCIAIALGLSCCKEGAEASVRVAGPSIALTGGQTEQTFHAFGCVVESPPDDGLSLEIQADVTATGGVATVELCVEQGNAFFHMDDGTIDVVTVMGERAVLSEMTGVKAMTPEFEAFCDSDPFEIRFRRVSGDVDVGLEWRAILAAHGGSLETELELRIE